MKEINTYRLEVDLYRNNGSVFRTAKNRLYQRPAAVRGVWFVGAKSADEARTLLQEHIKFGSITIPNHQFVPSKYQNLEYKEIRKWENAVMATIQTKDDIIPLVKSIHFD